MQEVNELVGILGERLGEVVDAEVVLGEPMIVGAFTLVPLSRLSVGVGVGGGKGEGTAPKEHRRHGTAKGKGIGAGSGGGARVRPVAMLAFGPNGVEVLPVPDKKGKLDKLMEKIPGWVDRFTNKDEED